MTLHLKKINDFGGKNGGGGGGDVVVKQRNYYLSYDENNDVLVGQGGYFFPFNIDNNKGIKSVSGYNGGLYTASLQASSITNISYLFGSSPVSNIAIDEEDRFFVFYFNNSIYYVPVNSNYTTGTMLSLNISDLGYTGNFSTMFILSSTRFGIYNTTNTKIGIFKLENGALVEDKSIDGSSLNIIKVSSFKGKLVLLVSKTSGSSPFTTGVQIMDADTEEILYEDVRDTMTNTPRACYAKDDYLFVYGWDNSTTVTEPIMIYEYSNGQFSKKSVSIIDYTPRKFSGANFIRAYKQSEGVYLVVTDLVGVSNSLLDVSFFVCDITNGTVEGNFFNAGNLTSFSRGFGIGTVNNEQRLLVFSSYNQSYQTFYTIYYGDYYMNKIPTTIQYEGNTFNLVKVGE